MLPEAKWPVRHHQSPTQCLCSTWWEVVWCGFVLLSMRYEWSIRYFLVLWRQGYTCFHEVSTLLLLVVPSSAPATAS
jgi:hypothetical protein